MSKYLLSAGKLGLFIISTIVLLPTAFAEGVSPGHSPQESVMSSMLIFGIIFIMFYILMIRPQNKRQKEHGNLITRLTVGDEVVTTGGILGKISKVTDNFFVIIISDGVEVVVQKQAIATALPKGTIKAL